MNSQSSNKRVWLLFVVLVSLFAILGLRLFDLQVLRASYFTALAASQRQRSSELAPARGTIYVSEGRRGEIFPVATNQKTFVVYAVPRDMEDSNRVAEQLAPALLAFRQRQADRSQDILEETGQLLAAAREAVRAGSAAAPSPTPAPPDETAARAELQTTLNQKFSQRNDPYEPLLKPYETIDQELRDFLEQTKLPGIVIEEQQRRIYPENTLAAHVLGYIGFDGEKRIGRYGIEEAFDQQLAGDLGWLFTELDTAGRFIGVGSHDFKPAEDGRDIVLSIDRVVQSYIEEELADGVARYGAERGSILVMNPKTGAVLGMATYPTYDPNHYYAITDPRIQSNPVVSDLFEPGSVLKPVNMAAAIEEGMVSPETTFNDTGPVRVAEYTIDTFDNKHWGKQTMTQVLEKSNNIGMVWLGQKLGAEKMYEYLRRFGVGEQTGIELAGETRNSLKPPEEWNVATVATTSFGQGVAITPLQALNAINAIANEGQLMQPYVVASTRAGEEADVHTPTVVRQAISPHTAEQVAAMMVSVIENGVATLARVPGYYLAGKTGTAQVPDERGRYSENKKIISFVGFGPVRDPQFSIMIKLDNPSGLSFASGTAAPMFRHVAEKLLNYYQIPPDYDAAKKQPTFQVPTPGTQPSA